MCLDFLLERFSEDEERGAIVWRGRTYTYGWLLAAVRGWQDRLDDLSVGPGTVVSLEADFSPNAVALLLALIERRSIIVPLTQSVETKKPEFRLIAQVEIRIVVEPDDSTSIVGLDYRADHELVQRLRVLSHPGLVLFSSGSTGKSKAVVHDFVALLEKFKTPRYSRRILTFLLFDHIGGINTLFYTISNTGSVITIPDRSPSSVCEAIEKYRVEVLPTSPTFLNLLLLSEAHVGRDLRSLQMVTYGTEVMPEHTLRRFHQIFPNVELLQTYGLSEVGIMRSKSKASDSLWVQIGGEGFETRVVDGILEVKARSAMLGYLNAPSAFTEDGWLKTGDAVEVDGGYYRILGRKSEIINVGGEKVYPVEVESVLQQMEGVEEVVVSGAPSPLTGQIVVAHVVLRNGESLGEFRPRMRAFCRGKLVPAKVPQKVIVAKQALHSERFKKLRRDG